MRRLAGLIAAALIATSCGSSGGADQGARVPVRTAPSTGSASGERKVAAALDFVLPGVTGPAVRGVDYAGKSLALWFWAPW